MKLCITGWVTSTMLLFAVLFSQAQENIRTVGNLPLEVMETSGLLFFNNAFITHNDSGNEPILYELDTLLLTVKRTVKITNVDNVDWEALAQDEAYIYIGDFGNNLGSRKDLAVHKILKSDYLSKEEVTATTSFFSFEDQTSFTDEENSDWDAEAFLAMEDSFVVLTKQWKSQGCAAYQFPKASGIHVATKIAAYENLGLVTDATYNPVTNALVILGYTTILSPFVGIVKDFSLETFFEGLEIKSLNLNFVQAEGITHTNDTNYYVTSENFSRTTPSISSASRLFSFTIHDLVQEDPPTEPQNPEEEESPDIPKEEQTPAHLIIYQEPTTKALFYKINSDEPIFAQAIYDVLGRKVWERSNEISREGFIDVPLEKTIYYFVTYVRGATLHTSFIPL